MPVLEFATASSDDLFTVPPLDRPAWAKGPSIGQELARKLEGYERERTKVERAQTMVRIKEAAQVLEFGPSGAMEQYEAPPDEIESGEAVDDIQGDELPESSPIVEVAEHAREGGFSIVDNGEGVYLRSDRRRNGKPLVTAFNMLHKRSLDPAELSDEDRAALIEIERERETREVIPCRYVLDMDGGLFVWKLRLVPIPMPSQAWTAISGLPIGGESDGYVMPEAIPGEYEHIINSRKPDPIRTYYAPGLGILEKLRHRAIKKAMAALVEFVEDISEIDKETKRILRESGLAG